MDFVIRQRYCIQFQTYTTYSRNIDVGDEGVSIFLEVLDMHRRSALALLFDLSELLPQHFTPRVSFRVIFRQNSHGSVAGRQISEQCRTTSCGHLSVHSTPITPTTAMQYEIHSFYSIHENLSVNNVELGVELISALAQDP